MNQLCPVLCMWNTTAENREQRKLFSEATRHVVLVAFLSVLSAHLAIPKDSL